MIVTDRQVSVNRITHSTDSSARRSRTSHAAAVPPRSIADIRAEVCERVDLTALALEAGFRRGKGPGKTFHCIHGQDRNPSARVYRGRLKCYSCGGSWSPIDLAMLARGCGYVEALRTLAAETSVPWPSLSPFERDRLRRASAAAPQLAQEIADWAHGLYLWAEQRKAALLSLPEALADTFEEQLSALKPALRIRSMNPKTIAETFVALKKSSPAVTQPFTEIGREDREHADLVTAGIVRLIASVQDSSSLPEHAN